HRCTIRLVRGRTFRRGDRSVARARGGGWKSNSGTRPMTDKDDTGKRPQPSAETPGVKRPHATLDLKATEVGGGSKPAGSGPQAAAGGPGAQASGRTRSDASASQ